MQTAHEVAEKRLCERLVKAVVGDYNGVSETLQEMKDQLDTYKKEMSVVAQKTNTCSANINKMESKQGKDTSAVA